MVIRLTERNTKLFNTKFTKHRHISTANDLNGCVIGFYYYLFVPSDMQKDSCINFFGIARHDSFNVKLITAQNILFLVSIQFFFYTIFSKSVCLQYEERNRFSLNIFYFNSLHTYLNINTIHKGLERKLKAYLVLLLTISNCTNEMALIQFQMFKRKKRFAIISERAMQICGNLPCLSRPSLDTVSVCRLEGPFTGNRTE